MPRTSRTRATGADEYGKCEIPATGTPRRAAGGPGENPWRERAARQRVEALQAELCEAEAVWERFVIARETVGLVLAEACRGDEVPPVVVAGERPVRTAAAVPGSVVPVWREGLGAGALAPDYRRLVEVLAGGSGSGGAVMDCRQLAVALGLEAVAAKVEGVRSKAKRLVARGWLTETRPGAFTMAAGRAGGS